MIESSCVYLEKDDCWLMLYRNKKKNDVNHDKWIGVGGKRKAGESIEQCAAREVMEETGYQIDCLTKEGIIVFHYPKAEDEMITVFSSTFFHGDMKPCDEGTLAWIKKDELFSLNLWEGDRLFMKRMLAGSSVPFRMTLSYNQDGQLTAAKEGIL